MDFPKAGHLIEVRWKGPYTDDEWSFGIVVSSEDKALQSENVYHRVEGSYDGSQNRQYGVLPGHKDIIDHGFACREIWEELGL